MRNWAARRLTLNPVHGAAFLHQRRAVIEAPTEDEVRVACAALGVSASCPLRDVKKRYVELAKQHHPDVNGEGAADASRRMVNINNAYATLNRFHKVGGVLPGSSQTFSSNGNNTNSSGSSQSYYTPQDEPYQPWHEDINPLIYEMMWDEMRRQAEDEAFIRATAHEPRRRRNYQQTKQQQQHQQQQQKQQQQQQPRHQQGTETIGGASKKAYGESRRHSKSGNSRTTTWLEEDLRAMVNMYQDGKSFDFIANALGKQTPDVVLEFNRWSEDNKRPSRPAQRRPRGYYYAESHDMDFADLGDDFGDPYGYGGCDDEHVDSEEVFFDGGAIPFSGEHYMSGHRPHRNGKGGGRGRHGSGHRQW